MIGSKPGVVVRLAEAPRMGELQADDEARRRCRPPPGGRRRACRASPRWRVGSAPSCTSCLGLARPSGATATASPPQISLAPLRPKRRQRRDRVLARSPSRSPSQPSIGLMAEALPIFMSGDFDRGRERRARPARDDLVARHVDPERGEMGAEARDAAKGADLRIFAELHVDTRPALVPASRRGRGRAPARESCRRRCRA